MLRARGLSKRALILVTSFTLAGGSFSFSGEELYTFSGRQKQQEKEKQQAGQAGNMPDQSVPQVQLREENRQQAGTAGTSIMDSKGGSPGNQLPTGTVTPLPGGGPKMGVGPVGPGGTSQTTKDPNEGPNRYKSRPPSWENLNEIDAGRNRNAPGEGNTSVASGYNIFGTTTVPFSVGPPNA